jgi:hypothetical protein
LDKDRSWTQHQVEFTDGEFTPQFGHEAETLDKDRTWTHHQVEFIDGEFTPQFGHGAETLDKDRSWTHHQVEFTDGEFTPQFGHGALQGLEQGRKKTKDEFVDGEFHRKTKRPMQRFIVYERRENYPYCSVWVPYHP